VISQKILSLLKTEEKVEADSSSLSPFYRLVLQPIMFKGKSKWVFKLHDNTKIVVRRVKRSEDDINNSDELWKKVLSARESYHVYGDVPLQDSYDKKSTIYLATVEYKDSGVMMNEEITMRLVPASRKYGGPKRTEDIDFTVFVPRNSTQKIPTIKILKDVGIDIKSIATISRLGARSSNKDNPNLYLAPAFAAIQLMMIEDAKKYHFDWIICQLHPFLKSQSLSWNGLEMHFVPAHVQLQLEHQGEFVLNRWNDAVWQYMLSYPAYFLDFQKTKEILTDMLGKRFTNDINWRTIRDLVPLFHKSPNHKIADKVTVGQIKNRLRNDVPDGVFLALMRLGEWERSASRVVKAAQLGAK
jgi:hypothetical protein